MRRAVKTIDPQALASNLDAVRRAAPHSRIMAVIKANAYGHGIVPVASALRNADGFAVAVFDEALTLRQQGFRKPILVMQGVHAAGQYVAAEALKLTCAVHSRAQCDMLGDANPDLWLKIDTGMHRLGFTVDEAAELLKGPLARCSGLMTHFANAEQSDDPATLKQITQFEEFTAAFSLQRSAANSAAILNYPQAHYEWVRPGLMLYGVAPDTARDDLPELRPAMRITAPVIAVHSLRAGDRVGYAGDFTCPVDMRVAVVSCGYGDGYPQQAGAAGGVRVMINGRRCALAGRVSMDMLAVQLEDDHEVQPGEEAELVGPRVPVEHLARALACIPYELLCRFSALD